MQNSDVRKGSGNRGGDRFDRSPLIAIWEVTRACDLACVHCRAEAIPQRETGELTTDEGKRLIRTIREFGKPFLVLTGGDPLKRPDIYDRFRGVEGSFQHSIEGAAATAALGVPPVECRECPPAVDRGSLPGARDVRRAARPRSARRALREV